MKKQHIQLSEIDRTYLEELVSKGELAVKVYRRALGLLELDRGKTYSAVASTLGVNPNTIAKWAKNYKVERLQCLQDKPRSGRPIEIDGVQRAKITALACSEAPAGYDRWTLRLLAEKAVELDYCDHLSHTEVADILKKNEVKPHLKRTWCLGQLDSRFIAQMERLLWLYSLPYDPLYPVICYDERPCFLIGDRIEPLALQSGQLRKEHYAYEKLGSAALLAAIEPLTGRRLAQVHSHRTKREYTLFCQALAAAHPEAIKIRLIQDNLNTHDPSAFYEYLPADEAWALAQRFEFYFTPKSASWLNMIEIEFSALTRLCLNRRIPTFEQLETEILAFFDDRDQKQIKINWQFSIQAARTKFKKHYVALHPDNDKFSDEDKL
jgi:transposase